MPMLHPVVPPAAAPLQRPALGSGCAQNHRGQGQGHKADAEHPHGAGVPAVLGGVTAGCRGWECAGTSRVAAMLLCAGMGQWVLAAKSKCCDFGFSSL